MGRSTLICRGDRPLSRAEIGSRSKPPNRQSLIHFTFLQRNQTYRISLNAPATNASDRPVQTSDVRWFLPIRLIFIAYTRRLPNPTPYTVTPTRRLIRLPQLDKEETSPQPDALYVPLYGHANALSWALHSRIGAPPESACGYTHQNWS